MDEPTEVLPASPPERTETLVGQTLGKFLIVEKLGRGGSGDVYRAEQPQLGRSAVIKVLRGRQQHKIERFLREAKLASRLDHPYAAHIYAFGAEADGQLWIAMEHVRGATLDEIISKRGAMPPSIFGPLFGRLCEVIHTAHELGIVHRDIKGSNVMVIERAGQLLPKLLDFGIAKDAERAPSQADDDDAQSTELTQEGSTLGSPHYMAPEQWRDASDVDARADIYALGALAFRCLAGFLPFRDADRRVLAQAHLSRPPPPLPDRLPRALDDAVARALAKRPDDRWATALAFGEAVRVAVGTSAPEVVPIFDPYTRDVWLRAGPQPIADAIARLVAAGTTVEADAAVRELVAITCRWLAVLALSLIEGATAAPALRERLRAVAGRDDARPWLELARGAASDRDALPGLTAALAGSEPLAVLASQLDDRERARTAAQLAKDIAAAADAMRPLEPLLAYQLVVGRGASAAELWQGPRRRDREPAMVWGEPLGDGEVALLDASGKVVIRLSPLAQVIAPLPSAEPELFLLWKSGRGGARLVAAPWGFERDDVEAGAKLAALTTEDSDTAHDANDDRSPYPGLVAFGVDDADRFVGREREVEALANRMIRAPMIGVLGPSGAGKSSFIHAGVVPRLGDRAHRVVTLRPGRHPMHALATAAGTDDAARLRALGDSARGGLVIVVDQLEELVTLCGDPDERRRFAETLAAAADGPAAPVRVIATLRDDFAGVLESEAAFRGKFEVFVLGTPLPEALRRIVVEPARRAAITVEPAVVDDMVAEVAGRPASLPLLSFTASQLWRARDKVDRRITHASYVALGGVAGALSAYADQIYDSLANRDQAIARELFARLVATDGTRVPTARDELDELPGARAVLAHLIDARLLVVRQDGDRDLVEIVHECLAERWTRLARWRREDASDRALIGDLRAAARRWNESSRDADHLWRGEQLVELRKLVARAHGLTAQEHAFATTALAAAARARRLRRGLVIAVIAVLAGVAGVMAYLGLAANRSADRASRSAELAEDRLTESLVAQGRRELADGHSIQALAYFGEAFRRGVDTRGLRTMFAFARRGWRDTLHVERGIRFIAIAGGAHGFVTASLDGTLRWWKDDGSPDGAYAAGIGELQTLELAPDGSLVAVGHDGAIALDPARALRGSVKPKHLVSAAHAGPGADEITCVEVTGVRVYGFDHTIRRELPLDGSPTTMSTHFARDGRHLLYTNPPELHVLDLVTMADTLIASDVASGIGESASEERFGYLDTKRVAHIVDGSGTPLVTIADKLRPAVVMFSASGDRIALQTDAGLDVYDSAGTQVGTYITEGGDAPQFLVRDDDMWITGADGAIRHSRAKLGVVSSIPIGATALANIALAGNAIGTLAPDGTLTIVRAETSQIISDPFTCEHRVFSAAGIAMTFECGGGKELRVYAGRRFLGVVPVEPYQINIALDDASGRAAIDSGKSLTIFDRDRHVIATEVATGDRPIARVGAVAFEDRDHVVVAAPGQPLWRWTLPDRWEQILPKVEAFSVIVGRDGAILLGGDKQIDLVVGGRIARTIPVGDRVAALTASPDRRWIAAQLDGGPTLILDGATYAIAKTLEPADANGGAPIFDASGELLLRQSHGALAIWDRATGDPLVSNFELLRGVFGGAFAADGRLEIVPFDPAILDIPLDLRPVPQLLADIACRVPLRVNGSRLEGMQPDCKSR